MNNKPKIGVLSLYDTSRASKWNSYWMFPGYTEGILAAGGIPYIIPILNDNEDLQSLVNTLDGFLFTGGQDIDPRLYGKPVYTHCGPISPERDQMESVLLRMIQEKDKPLLGICRGLQLINVAFGGSLYQDLERERKAEEYAIQHMQATEFIHPVHQVRFEKESRLFEIFGKEALVNSMHHQGIQNLGKGLRATAYAEDGLIEGIEIEGMTFGMAVQWHPEFLWDQNNKEKMLFEAFVKSAKEKGE